MKPILASIGLATILSGPVQAENPQKPQSQKVTGYFCDNEADFKTFLGYKQAREGSVVAADRVNKMVKKQSCAPWNHHAVPGKQKTVISNGAIITMQDFTFDDGVTRTTGAVLGVLAPQELAREADI